MSVSAQVSDLEDLSIDGSKFKLGQKVAITSGIFFSNDPAYTGYVTDIYVMKDDEGEILYKYEINQYKEKGFGFIYPEYELDIYEDYNDILKRLVNV